MTSKPRQLGQVSLKECFVFPLTYGEFDGVISPSGEAVAGYGNEILDAKRRTLDLKSNEFAQIKFDLCNDEAVFLGMSFGQYGHFLVEEMMRLWWVLQNGVKGKKFVFAVSEKFTFQEFHKYIFSLFGLDESNLVFVTKPTKFASLIVPDCSSFWLGGKLCFVPIQKEVINRIASSVTPQENEKIYLSRSKTTKGNIREFGEAFFEEFYAKQGYKIIHPQTLSFKDQVAIFQGCKEIVSTGGSLAHNAVFAKEGTKLTILLKTSEPNLYQDYVNELAGVEADYKHCYLELVGVNTGRGPFLMLPPKSEFSKQELKGLKKDIQSYLYVYKIELMKGMMHKVECWELQRSFEAFKQRVTELDARLASSLQGEFKSFSRWIKLKYTNPKLAWVTQRLKNLPRKVKEEIYRAWQKVKR